MFSSISRQGVLVQLLVCLNVGKLLVITVRNPLLEPMSKGKLIRFPQYVLSNQGKMTNFAFDIGSKRGFLTVITESFPCLG